MVEDKLEELTQLKKEVEELKGEKIRLNINLYDLYHNYASLKRDHEGVAKKKKGERKYTLKLQQDLAAANVELSMRVREKHATLSTTPQ